MMTAFGGGWPPAVVVAVVVPVGTTAPKMSSTLRLFGPYLTPRTTFPLKKNE